MSDQTAPKAAPNPPPKPDEPPAPRSFSRFLATLAEGQAEGEASYEMNELLKHLDEEARSQVKQVSGKLVVEISFFADETSTCKVTYKVKRTDPKRRTEPSHFWLDKKSQLVAENPRQQKLPLRAVEPAPAPRQLDSENNNNPREV